MTCRNAATSASQLVIPVFSFLGPATLSANARRLGDGFGSAEIGISGDYGFDRQSRLFGGVLATRRVGFDLIATVGGPGYVMKTPGGSTDTSTSTSTISYNGTNGQPSVGCQFAGTIAVPVAGAACAGSGSGCSAEIRGFLSGVGGAQAGITYAIGNSAGATGQTISGAAAFVKP